MEAAAASTEPGKGASAPRVEEGPPFSSTSTSSSTRNCWCGLLTPARALYLRANAGELVVTLFLVVYGLAISGMKPMTTPFLERDPSLSQLGADVDTVPNTQLIYISFVLPVLSLVFFTALESRLTRGRIVIGDVAWTVLWRFVALCQALGVALAATNTIKNTAARQRPSFFDLTNYAGYHAAVHTNTPSAYAAYDAGTVAGQLGSLSKALSTAKLDDAQRSFPSGHASLSFSGMAFLVGLARTILRVRPGVWFSPRAFVACAPLVLAAFIAISRVRDRKHNPDDVSVGTALGILGGVLAWQQYAAEARARDALVVEAEEVEGLAKGARRGGADGSASAEV